VCQYLILSVLPTLKKHQDTIPVSLAAARLQGKGSVVLPLTSINQMTVACRSCQHCQLSKQDVASYMYMAIDGQLDRHMHTQTDLKTDSQTGR